MNKKLETAAPALNPVPVKMAEQLFLSGNIDEKVLCSLNITQTHFDICVALLPHSGT